MHATHATPGFTLPHTPPHADSKAPAQPRVLLFTDTLGDVNGVSRFIRSVADCALESGRDLTVLTSTRFELPQRKNIVNIPPVHAIAMPGYENLELVWPRVRAMLRFAEQHKPTAIHVSTPGPVGFVGRWAAKRLRVPLLGTYHTDFPAYIERLFELEALTWTSRETMARFYAPFSVVFTRSPEYRGAVRALGIADERIQTLRPGIKTGEFQPHYRDESIWKSLTPSEGSSEGRTHVRVLSVGRVSVEKNLPFLSRVWRRADATLRQRGVAASLIVVGDGPYLETMRRELDGTRTHFLGFRHGEELSRIYASSDLFVFPSTTDTLGQVVLESQCAGLPVLVTDQGGPKGVVRAGETGLVLSAERESDWIEAIVTMASDRERLTRMGKAANAYASGLTIEKSFEHFWQMHGG